MHLGDTDVIAVIAEQQFIMQNIRKLYVIIITVFVVNTKRYSDTWKHTKIDSLSRFQSFQIKQQGLIVIPCCHLMTRLTLPLFLRAFN